MNLPLAAGQVLAEDGKLFHTSPSLSATRIPPVRSFRHSVDIFQMASFPSRALVSSFSRLRWLRKIETDRVFNKAAFDLLGWYRRDSTCPEEKVVAVIFGYAGGLVELLSLGINGSPLDYSNPPLYLHKRTCEHAEQRALKQLSASSGLYQLICYVSMAPCLTCAENLFRRGVEAVAYDREYRDRSGTEFLLNKGVPVYNYQATREMVSLNPDLCWQPFASVETTAPRCM